jgi:hypothetical protein
MKEFGCTGEKEQMDKTKQWHQDHNLKYGWFDCTCEVKCLCGKNNIMLLSDEGEPRECDECGRTYRLVSYVEVKESK